VPVLPDLDQDRPDRALRDDPVLPDPVLPDPVLPDPVLPDPVLPDRPEPVLADAGSARAAIPQMSQ
jgi:autotransporter family porin